MAGHIVGMHRDMRMRKALLDTVSCAQLNSVVLNSKLPKVVSYIQYNKYWESIYVILKIILSCIWLLCLDDDSKSGMDKVYYYSKMTNIPTFKSSTNINNKELLPVSGSSILIIYYSSLSIFDELHTF